jgi:hypothetical protein
MDVHTGMGAARATGSGQQEHGGDHGRRVTVAESPETWDRPCVQISPGEQRGLVPLALDLVAEVFGDDVS